MALKQSSFGRALLFALVLMAQPAPAQISAWKLGGAGLSWSESDTTRLFIDFVSAPSSIQLIYLTPEKTVFCHLGTDPPAGYRLLRGNGYVEQAPRHLRLTAVRGPGLRRPTSLR